MSISITRAAVVGVALLAAPMAQAATLDELTFSAGYYFPDQSTPYVSASPNPTGPFVAAPGPGIDAGLIVEGVTSIGMDFSGNSLNILFGTILSAPSWTDVAFNGLRIALESPGSFTAFALTGSTIGPVTTSFDAHTLWIDWGGSSYVNGSTLTFDIGYAAPAPVPLPAGLPLLALALGGLAVLGRRRAA